MADRNLSPQRMFELMWQDFAAWKEQALPEVMATLGSVPDSVRANPELMVEWKHDGLIKQRWLINVGEHISAMFLVNFREDIPSDEKRPAIMCWHGHGNFGKEPVMGNVAGSAVQAEVEQFNYSYGHQMAKLGFVTYAIDWMGMGERDDKGKPNFRSQGGNRDWCNLYYLHATMLGTTSLAINLAHGRAATDFACTLPQVDGERFGVMGLSGGGTMTVWSALFDSRFSAAEVICYSDLWEHFGISDINYCGTQVAPGLYALVDMPELQGLMAPRPLLVNIGASDGCFQVSGAIKCFERVKNIYAAADVSDNLELDLFPGGHRWGGNKSAEFFKKHLGL